jgi:hypothetical protein
MLTAIKALKLVSLGISDTSLLDTAEVMLPEATLSLRDTAQWYPDVPDKSLCLNEATFPGMSCKPFDYRPLAMMLYGGPQAMHLSKLVEIAVWIVDVDGIYGIDFTYNAEVDGKKVHTLGRCGPLPDLESTLYEPLDDSTDQRIIFPIDGPGGEKINGVDIQTKSLQMKSFRVSLSSSMKIADI